MWAIDAFVDLLLLPMNSGANSAADRLGNAMRLMFVSALILILHGTMLSSSVHLFVSCAKGNRLAPMATLTDVIIAERGSLRWSRFIRTCCGCQWKVTKHRGCSWWSSMVLRPDDEPFLVALFVLPLFCALVAALFDITYFMGVFLYSGAVSAICVTFVHGCMRMGLAARILVHAFVRSVIDVDSSGRMEGLLSVLVPSVVARVRSRSRNWSASAQSGAAGDRQSSGPLCASIDWRDRAVLTSVVRDVVTTMGQPLLVFVCVTGVLVAFFLPSSLDYLVRAGVRARA